MIKLHNDKNPYISN